MKGVFFFQNAGSQLCFRLLFYFFLTNMTVYEKLTLIWSGTCPCAVLWSQWQAVGDLYEAESGSGCTHQARCSPYFGFGQHLLGRRGLDKAMRKLKEQLYGKWTRVPTVADLYISGVEFLEAKFCSWEIWKITVGRMNWSIWVLHIGLGILPVGKSGSTKGRRTIKRRN